MSRSLLQRLAAETAAALSRLRDNLSDPEARRATYGEVGVDPDLEPPPETTWEGLNQLDRYAGEAEPDLRAWRETVDDTVLMMRSVRDVFEAAEGGDVAQAQARLRALVAVTSLSHVRERLPVLHAFARLLGVVEETAGVHLGEQLRQERIEAIFSGDVLDVSERDEDDQEDGEDREDGDDRFLDSEADAQRLSDLTLLPLAGLLYWALGKLDLRDDVTVLYGWDPLPESPTPQADRLAGRALSAATTLDLTADGTDGEDGEDGDEPGHTVGLPVALTVLWMPREHGGPALLASLDAASLSGTVDRGDDAAVRVSVDLGGFDRATLLVPLVGDARSDMLAGFGVSERGYEVTVESVGTQGTDPWVLGDASGLRLEVGRFALSLGYRVTGQGPSLDASFTARLVARDSRLVVATGEADPVVRASLDEGPDEVLRAPFDLGIVLEARSDGTSVHLEGGTGLNAVLPVGRTAGPLRVHHVGLSVGGTGDDGRPLLVVEATVALTLDLGWVVLALDGVGIAWDLRSPRDLGFRSPTGIGLEVALGPVSGGGFLRLDPERGSYAVVLSLDVEPFWFIERSFSVTAVAILGVQDGRRSLLAMLGLQWEPWHVGLGFTLNGVGGVLAENRTVAVEALHAGLRGRDLDPVLFPDDPARNAPALVAALDRLFPPSPGQRVVGLMVRFGWGVPNVLVGDVAVLHEEPSPRRVVLLGQLAAEWRAGDRLLVDLRLDVVGSWHTDSPDVALDGTLHRSRVAGFAVDGDGAWRSRGGDQPVFLFSVGGYHPDVEPPSHFPALRRLSFDLLSGENPRVRFEAYFALTSNTLQTGGRVELFYAKAGFSLEGSLALDVLLDRQECAFVVTVDVMVSLKRGSTTIAGVRFTGSVSGTSPWCVTGSATLELFFFSVSFPVDVTAGQDAPPAALAPARAHERLAAALRDPRSWQSEIPPDARSVTSLREPADDGTVCVHPLGALAVSQTVLPLEVTIDHLDTAPLDGPRRFSIDDVTVGEATLDVTQVRDHFAPAQFFALSDDERMARPSFERLPSGVAAAVSGGSTHGTAVPAEMGYETVIHDAAGHRSAAAERAVSATAMTEAVRAVETAQGVRGSRGRRGDFEAPGDAGGRVGVDEPRFQVVSADDLRPSGVPELDRLATFTEQRDALARHVHDHPDDRRRLRLVGAHEAVPQ